MKREANAAVYFDTIIAKIEPNDSNNMFIKVESEHDSQRFSDSIDIKEFDFSFSLNFRYNFIIDKYNSECFAHVAVSIGNKFFIQENINLKSNIIGALKSKDSCSITLVFRVINYSTDDFIIYNVPRFHYKDYEITKMLGIG